MQRNDPRWAYPLVILATVLWASNIVLGRALRDHIGPITLTTLRFSIAVVLMLVILNRRSSQKTRKSQSSPPALIILLVLMGLSGVVGFPVLMYLALKYTTASHAALINAASPLITAILSTIFLRDQLRLPIIIGAVISLAGVGLVITNGTLNFLGTAEMLRGDLIALVTAALWGVYSILSRVAARFRSSLELTNYSALLSLPLLMPMMVFEWGTQQPDWTPLVILAVVYIGIFPTVIAFFSWNESVRRAGPNQAMAFYNLMPVFSSILGVVFLGERLTWSTILGGVLVILGGILVVMLSKKS